MSKFSKFLTSLLCILPLTAAAVTWEGKPDDLQITGFVFATDFSDKDWYNGRSIAAVNLDYDLGNFAVRTQVSSYKDQVLRRFVLEASTPTFMNSDLTVQAGRFSRVDSFYNGITDNPASYQMAMLPSAGYSYRMFNGAFTIMDGINVFATWRNDDVLVKVRYARGRAAVPNQGELINEAFKRPLTGVNEVFMQPQNDSEDYGFNVDTEFWRFYGSKYTYNFNTEKVGTSALARTVATLYAGVDYRIDRFGVKYDNNTWWFTQEWFHDYTYTMDARSNGNYNTAADNIGNHWVAGYRYTEQWAVYGGQSTGHAKMSYTHNKDNFIGVTWNNFPFTVSTEYHRGEGFAWRKYDAPFVNYATQGYPQWSSWVISGTYVF